MVLRDFQRRISQGIRLFVLSALILNSAFGFEPTTEEGRTNRSAFAILRFQDRYRGVTPQVESALRRKFEQVLGPIRLLPEQWFTEIFALTLQAGSRARLLNSISETEIWKCMGEFCSGCPSGESLGCILNAKTPTGVGVVAVIHPCLYGDGKCTKKGDDADTWAERLVASTVFYKLGLSNSTQVLKKVESASSAWIRRTSSAVNEILGACPGPYSKKAITFLSENRSISTPNEALKKCGERYFTALQDLPNQCPALKNELKELWNLFSKDQFKKKPEILRCNSFCRKMFCRGKGASSLLTEIDKNPTLLLFDGACEGETANFVKKFIGSALPKSLKKRLENLDCLPKDVKEEDSGISGLGNGPEIQLVE